MEYKMTFGQAIEYLKEGLIVTRSGWNGKGMFIFMRPSDEINIATVISQVKSLPKSVKNYFAVLDAKELPSEQGLTNIKFTAYLCMKAADGTIVNGWLASQTDMLANDWGLFEVEEIAERRGHNEQDFPVADTDMSGTR